MKKYRAVYVFIALLTVVGSGLVLADAYQSVLVEDLSGAVECADTSSTHCYQVYPGVITSVRVTQVSAGQRDEVSIASQNTSVRVSLLPSPSEAALVQVGATVSVQWYVGSVASVLIGGHAIKSTSSPLNREDFAYAGWTLIWLAAAFGAIMLVTRKLAKAPVAPWVTAITDVAFGVTGSQVILPTGTIGWSIRPRLKEVVVLPFVLVVLALVSIRPFMNPDHLLIASVVDALVVAAALLGLVLTVRNSRVMADSALLMKADRLGRIRRWPLTDIDVVADFYVQGPFSVIRCFTFIGQDGTELFTVSSMFWDLDEVEALCETAGLEVDFDYYLTRDRPRSRRLRAAILAVSLATTAVTAWSFYPLPR
jgi:hypothetical protein